jgi:hypothetical protein
VLWDFDEEYLGSRVIRVRRGGKGWCLMTHPRSRDQDYDAEVGALKRQSVITARRCGASKLTSGLGLRRRV